jgi:hypothetical protein
MGQNSEKLDRMSKQIQSGDEQNLELSESLRAAIEKLPPANSNKQASEKSIEDDAEKGKKLRLLNLLQETTFDRTKCTPGALKVVAAELLKQLMLQLKEW